MQHQRQNKLQSKRVSKHIAAALASHQDVPTSKSNGAGGGKPRVMVIGKQAATTDCQDVASHNARHVR